MQQSEIQVHEVSLSTAMVIALCGGHEISRSTGFVWSHNDCQYLVTSWHSVTGVNPFTGRFLSTRFAARPDAIRVALVTNKLGRKLGYEVPLFDERGDPRCQVHPRAGEQVDVVAIALPSEDKRPQEPWNIAAKAMNQIDSQQIQAFVGDELFVVGYPRNLHMHGLPIWKRAAFATEPNLFRDEPSYRQVWIDCTSREGMSGSPVIQVARDWYQVGNPMSSVYRFFGLYSGRILDPDADPRLDDQLLAQIGIIWPEELVQRVVSEGVRDKFRRENQFEATTEVLLKAITE